MTRELLQQALAYVRWDAFGQCRTPGWEGPPPTASEVSAALEAAFAQQVQPAASNNFKVTDAHIELLASLLHSAPGDLQRDLTAFCHDARTALNKAALAQPAQPAATREAFEAWQPIETAPKDGKPILVANNIRGGSWIACYCPVNSHGCKLVNPWHCMMLNTRWHNTPHATTAPTVWQPLPLPPVAAEAIRARSNDASCLNEAKAKRPVNCGTGHCSCIECLFEAKEQ